MKVKVNKDVLSIVLQDMSLLMVKKNVFSSKRVSMLFQKMGNNAKVNVISQKENSQNNSKHLFNAIFVKITTMNKTKNAQLHVLKIK